MAKTKIEWAEVSWNPITGCTKISSGCKHCYAERMAKRLQAMGNPNYEKGFQIQFHPDMLERPLTWKKSRKVFVNSMSDLFHEDISLDVINQIVDVMRRADWHIFQILTKRSRRLAELSKEIQWPKNVWLGVSVENQKYTYRISDLQKVNVGIKFISFEPLIGEISSFKTQGINWVIVGGESGPKARPIKKEWVTSIRDTCIDNQIPFFFKQWGGFNKKKNGRTLEGKIWNQFPTTARYYSYISN